MWFWKHVVLAVDSIDVVFVGVCAEMVGKVFHCYRSGQNYLARFTVPHALKRPHCIILPPPCFTKGDGVLWVDCLLSLNISSV